MKRVLVITGTRAEFGLLRTVMHAIEAHPDLALRVAITGTHLLPPEPTAIEVSSAFPVHITVPMQRPGEEGHDADALALGRGVLGFAEAWGAERPDIVVVLGDRIEAFAAASAAAAAGIQIAHLHGGDRAEGIADEALRHAISKLAHIHLPATEDSAERLRRMGEDPTRIHVVGSPAIDELEAYEALPDAAFDALGRPEIVLLLHPGSADETAEERHARFIIDRCAKRGRVLALYPNHDPGARGIRTAIEATPGLAHRRHLPRPAFVGLLRRARMLVGNSSAGLIEGGAIPIRCVNLGPRQSGRLMPPHVVDCAEWIPEQIDAALDQAGEPLPEFEHPYGSGTTGTSVAAILASVTPDNHPLRKHNTY